MWPFKKNVCVDQVWMVKEVIYCQFSATGRTGDLIKISPSQTEGSVTAFRVIEDGSDFSLATGTKTIETFANQQTAKQAQTAICQALKGQSAGQKWRRPGLILGVPLLVFVFLLVVGSKNQPTIGPIGASPPVSMPYPGDYDALLRDANGGRPLDAAPEFSPAKAAPAQVDLKEVQGLNMIAFGKGKPALYVFSDPACPSCKELDQIFKDKKISYAVIPVALLGENSALSAARVMCAKSPAAAWSSEMDGQPSELETKDRKALAGCAQKVIDNMKAFRRLGLMATPTIISASTGRLGLPQSAEELDELTQAKK